jgi:hypothetical protein
VVAEHRLFAGMRQDTSRATKQRGDAAGGPIERCLLFVTQKRGAEHALTRWDAAGGGRSSQRRSIACLVGRGGAHVAEQCSLAETWPVV